MERLVLSRCGPMRIWLRPNEFDTQDIVTLRNMKTLSFSVTDIANLRSARFCAPDRSIIKASYST
jgi:hypothetical protein